VITYEQVYQAISGTDQPWGGCHRREQVERVMRLILGDSVWTRADLAALRPNTKLLDTFGEVWRAWRWDDDPLTFYSTLATLGPYTVDELAARGPLIIVWQPEDTP
jgi:hypothetical protein